MIKFVGKKFELWTARSRSLKILGQLSNILLTVALLFIAWVWLLHFPWSWVLKTTIVMEILAVTFVVLCEYSGREVVRSMEQVAGLPLFI